MRWMRRLHQERMAYKRFVLSGKDRRTMQAAGSSLVSQWQNILESIQEIRGGDEYACSKHSVSGKRHCADAGVFLLVCCVIALETSGIQGADDFQLRQTAKAFGMVDIVGMSLYYSVGCYGKSGGCFVGFR